jgi:hypothetical protein
MGPKGVPDHPGRWRVAIHEAGDAVIGRILGMRRGGVACNGIMAVLHAFVASYGSLRTGGRIVPAGAKLLRAAHLVVTNRVILTA